MVYISHRHCAAKRVAVQAGRCVADWFAIAVNRFASPKDRLRIIEEKNHEAPFYPTVLLFLESITSGKMLSPIDGES